MFGQHDDTQQSTQVTGSLPPDVPADGSLGMPMPPQDNPSMPLPSVGDDTGAMPPASGGDDEASASATPSSRNMHAQTPEELITIKQEALQSLKPLVGHLDQNAEERFRTVMMMIQASDDQALIPEAYEAAKAIEDDKVRAQALLDVVNEINYFTVQATQN